jgi:hypothetical protein
LFLEPAIFENIFWGVNMKVPDCPMHYVCAAALIILAGCAGTYSPPRIDKEDYIVKVHADKGKIYRATMFVLRRSGFRFAFADLNEGRITTRPRTTRLSNKDCDCGTGMGIGFASDSRTSTDVSFFIIAKDNEFTLRSIINGQYIASDTSTVKRFECVSRGGLEKDLAKKIKEELASAAEEMAVEQPAIEPPPAEEPAVEEPAAEESATEEPPAEEPAGESKK